MPVTIQHQLVATTPDNTTAEIRPSHWNSAHAVTLSLVASEVVKYISAGANSASSGTVNFSNGNGVTFGMNTAGVITASHNGITAQSVESQGIRAVQAGGNTLSAGTLSFSNANGVTWGLNGSTLTASVGTAVQSAQTVGIYASSNTTGQSSSSTVDARSLSIVGRGDIFVGMSAGQLIVSRNTTDANSFNILAAGTQTAGTATTVQFANSNGIVWGMSGSNQITASYTQSGQAVSAPNGSSAFQTLSFADQGGVSWSVSNGSIVAVVGTVASKSHWNPYPAVQTTAVQVGQGSIFVQPMVGLQPVSLSRFDLFASVSVSSSSNSSHAGALSFDVGIYSRNGSTLSLVTSGSQSYQWSNTSDNSLGSISGLRRFSVPINFNAPGGGDYWVAALSRSDTTNADWFSASNARVSMASSPLQGLIGEVSNSSKQLVPGQGLWSTTSVGMPASIALSDIRGMGAGVANNALPFVIAGNNFTA